MRKQKGGGGSSRSPSEKPFKTEEAMPRELHNEASLMTNEEGHCHPGIVPFKTVTIKERKEVSADTREDQRRGVPEGPIPGPSLYLASPSAAI